MSLGGFFSLVVESLASNMRKSTEWNMRSLTAILASLGSHKKKLSPLSSRELPAQLHFIPPQKNSYPKNVANLLPQRCWFSFPELESPDSPASHVRFQGMDPIRLVDETLSSWKFGCHLRCHLQMDVCRLDTLNTASDWTNEASSLDWPHEAWSRLTGSWSDFFSWIFQPLDFCLGQNKRNVCKFILVHRKW